MVQVGDTVLVHGVVTMIVPGHEYNPKPGIIVRIPGVKESVPGSAMVGECIPDLPGVDMAALVAVIADVGVEEVIDALQNAETFCQYLKCVDVFRRLAAAMGGGK